MMKAVSFFLFAAVGAVAAFGAVPPLAFAPERTSWVGGRFYVCLEHHLRGQDPVALSECFRSHEETWAWQTEFWGKYMHSAVPFAVWTGDAELRAKIDAGIANLLSCQLEDGYLGNYKPELRAQEWWDVWGMNYTLLGLLHYHDAFHEAASLRAAVRLADYLMAEVGPGGKRRIVTTGQYHGLASCSLLEPIVWLYRVTGEARFLAFADEIVQEVGFDADGPQLVTKALAGVPVAERDVWKDVKHNQTKAYEMMSCYQGMLDYADVKEVRREEICRAVEMTVDEILRDEINIIGGAGSNEHWYGGARKQTLPYVHPNETCVTTTWLRLLERLHRATGRRDLVDAWERTFYNVYLGAFAPDGCTFASYPPLDGRRTFKRRQCGLDTDCCNQNGARGFVSMHNLMFGASEISQMPHVALNLYVPGEYDVSCPYGRERLRVETDWPLGSRVKLTVLSGTPLPLFRRVPGEQRYVLVEGLTNTGDSVTFDLPLAWRMEKLNDHVAFCRGPVAYARVGDDLLAAVEPKKTVEEYAALLKELVPYAKVGAQPCRVWLPLQHHPWDDYLVPGRTR